MSNWLVLFLLFAIGGASATLTVLFAKTETGKALLAKFFADSETLFLARMQWLFGAALTVASPLDWSAALVGGLDWRERLGIGAVIFFKGVASEIARKHRAGTM